MRTSCFQMKKYLQQSHIYLRQLFCVCIMYLRKYLTHLITTSFRSRFEAVKTGWRERAVWEPEIFLMYLRIIH